jgi:BirA family biotin operon repressor/biotin-[acetyl-CoA-carboxylase] ligase
MNHIHVSNCESTFEILKSNYDYSDLLVSCDNQLKGRGRGHNSWDFFKNSIAMSFNAKESKVLTLTSIEIGVLICDYFKQSNNINLNLKWPNDIIKDGLKVGGILIESFNDTYLIGIGLNTYLEANESFNTYKVAAGNLFDNEQNINKEKTCKDLCVYIHKNRFSNMDMLIKRFNSLCFHFNKEVEIYDGDNIVGVFKGLNSDGSAIIENSLTTKSVYSGSLRLLV